jgi:hypothetical protein
MTRPESGHRRRHDRRGSGGEYGQAQCAAPQPGDGLKLGLGFPEVAKDRAGAVGERLARRILRPRRSMSRVPTSRSSWATCWEMADWL